MKHRVAPHVGRWTPFFLATLLASCGGSEVAVASAHAPDGITVTGSGEVHAAPDVARIHLGVEVHAPEAAQAIAQTNARMNAVVAALRGAGVAERDLRTSQVSVHRVIEHVDDPAAEPPPDIRPGPPPPPPPSAPRGRAMYRAANTVEATLRDLARVGATLSAAMQAGANDVHGISFTIDDPKPVERQARDKAMADAKARAEQLAQLAGVTLGRVVSIQDGGGDGGFPPPMPMESMMRADVGGPVPIQPGETRVTRQVVVRYAIGK
jgi:uncharacterized protein